MTPRSSLAAPWATASETASARPTRNPSVKTPMLCNATTYAAMSSREISRPRNSVVPTSCLHCTYVRRTGFCIANLPASQVMPDRNTRPINNLQTFRSAIPGQFYCKTQQPAGLAQKLPWKLVSLAGKVRLCADYRPKQLRMRSVSSTFLLHQRPSVASQRTNDASIGNSRPCGPTLPGHGPRPGRPADFPSCLRKAALHTFRQEI
jgi:hypothetical protein